MVSRLGLGAGTLFAGLMLASTAVIAAEVASLVEATDGAIACWQQTASAEALAAQPERVVTDMRFAIRHDTDVNDHPNYYSFVMEADLRDGRSGRAEGPCLDQADSISCGVECDGGGFDITPGADGSMLVNFERKGFVRMSPTCANGGSGDFSLEPASVESPFALTPMDQAECETSHLAVVYPEPEVD